MNLTNWIDQRIEHAARVAALAILEKVREELADDFAERIRSLLLGLLPWRSMNFAEYLDGLDLTGEDEELPPTT